ncbi:MAG: hypothetical protein HY700_04705 [Gemmatimonadetes bacterium]|nr:hypothetical protein [Gemmatimonadota bacterium]
MRTLTRIAVLLVFACTGSGGVRETGDTTDYSSAIVFFVSPDSQEISRLKEELGDDFYVAAVGGKPQRVSWRDEELTWFSVVYDGKTEPKISADVDLRSVLPPSTVKSP